MKVTGPGSGLPPEAPRKAQETDPAGGAAGGQRTAEPGALEGEPFAHTLRRTTAAGGTNRGVAATGTVAEIGAALQAGQITAEAALERVIARVLDRQLGTTAPAAVREKVGAALRQALEDDPVLAEKVRALAR